MLVIFPSPVLQCSIGIIVLHAFMLWYLYDVVRSLIFQILFVELILAQVSAQLLVERP